MILCANPHAQYETHKADIDAAIKHVLDNGRYVLGPEVTAFENEFAAYIGVDHGIGVGSGTEALHLALAACDIGAGDEVITVSHTAVATVSAIELAGATPVFADIEPDTFTIDPQSVKARITKKTKAIIAVHLYGQMANITALTKLAQEHKLKLIEDCAQAPGATFKGKRAGGFGDCACFSFYPTKNLGAIGDGGMVVTRNADIAKKARLLREYGWAERYVSHIPGWNSRLDELQAAILRVKLRHLDTDNLKRQSIADQYVQGLRDTSLQLPFVRSGNSHIYHLFVIRSDKRDALSEFLNKNDIRPLIHYPVPVHLQPAYKGRIAGSDTLPQTEWAAREVLSLPMYPELSEQDVRTVIKTIFEFEKR
jgi:dTDP-4-amino-4,6-dideoxygalactose transaminase